MDAKIKIEQFLKDIKESEVKHGKKFHFYKKIHGILYMSQILANSLAVGACSGSMVTMASGFGVPASLPLSAISVLFSGVGIGCHLIDKQIMKKMHENNELRHLSQLYTWDIFSNYLADGNLDEMEAKKIIEDVQKYYDKIYQLHSKNLAMNGFKMGNLTLDRDKL